MLCESFLSVVCHCSARSSFLISMFHTWGGHCEVGTSSPISSISFQPLRPLLLPYGLYSNHSRELIGINGIKLPCDYVASEPPCVFLGPFPGLLGAAALFSHFLQLPGFHFRKHALSNDTDFFFNSFSNSNQARYCGTNGQSKTRWASQPS